MENQNQPIVVLKNVGLKAVVTGAAQRGQTALAFAQKMEEGGGGVYESHAKVVAGTALAGTGQGVQMLLTGAQEMQQEAGTLGGHPNEALAMRKYGRNLEQLAVDIQDGRVQVAQVNLGQYGGVIVKLGE